MKNLLGLFGLNSRGVTLVELIIVISIMGIVAVAVGFTFQDWVGGYNIESQIKQIHTDLMYTRSRAMDRNRTHFFVFSNSTSYTIYEDMNPGPDGNRTLETSDTQLPGYPKTLRYGVNWSGGGTVPPINFDKRGFINPNSGTISIASTQNPDYDCITFTDLKINMGKMNGANCIVK
jgi:prepilin-type N-terminal cleavage/methylation domain-containing protein